MRLGFVTDLHLDFVKTVVGNGKLHRIGQTIASVGLDALVVSGDIADGHLKEYLPHFIEGVGKPVYFTLGNHDFWNSYEPHVWEAAREFDGFLDKGLVVELTPTTALVGVTGWYDLRVGDYIASNVIMAEMGTMPRFKGLGPNYEMVRTSHGPRRRFMDWPLERVHELARRCREFADDQTRAFLPALERAATSYAKVFIATHFPLWGEACWDAKGGLTRDNPDEVDWLPWSINAALGYKVQALAEDFPHVNFQVLSGHTHHYGEAQLLPNLWAYSGASNYGSSKKVKIWDL